ncbi:MAG: hypothetical protein J0I12_08560 [Candidatus Eremiobacteraeota bacterium]|nr:hypothetical protein [Candidatus Eremiobacteraeota bacterium]
MSTLFLSGCGGSSSSDAPSFANQSQLTRPIGRVYLQEPVAGAPVTFRDLQGNILGRTLTTAIDGEIPGLVGLPQSFFIQVDLPDGETLGTQVDSYDGETSSIVVNVPTTLALLLRVRHPEWTHQQAGRRVVEFLAAAPSCTPESLDNSRHGYFLASSLLREAGTRGGLGAFLRLLVEEAEAGRTHAFVAEPVKSLSELIDEAALELAKDGLAGAGTAGAEAAVGWVCEALGFNNPFPSMLDIANQIRALSDQITNLAASVNRNAAQSDYNQLVARLGTDVVEPIQLQSSTLQTTINSAVNANVTAPIPVDTVSSGVNAMVNAFQVFAARSGVNELSDNLIGAQAVGGVSRRLERLLTALDTPPLGLPSDLNVYMGYEVIKNSVVEARRDVLNYYLGNFSQGGNLVAEQLHFSQSSATMVANIRQGQVDFRKWSQDQKLIALQLPAPLPSDNVLLDRKHGLMWFTDRDGTNFHQRGHSDAVKEAQNFPGTGPYTTGWRLPTKDELINHLYHDHIKPAADAQSVAGDKRSQVLFRLNWDISYFDKDHTVWASDDTARVHLDNGNHENGVLSFHNNDIVLVRTYPGADDNYVTGLGHVDPLSVRMEVAPATLPNGQVRLRALAQVQPANANGGKGSISEVDVTSGAIWRSSNDALASVSNAPGSEGLVTWHAQLNGTSLAPVTITCQYYKPQSSTNFQIAEVASLSLQPPATAPIKTLSSIQPFPRNVAFNLPTAQVPIQQRFSAVHYYLDPNTGDAQVQDYLEGSAPTITWTLTDRNNQALDPSENSGFTDGNLLVLRSTLRTSDLNVHARVGSVEAIVPIHCAVSR